MNYQAFTSSMQYAEGFELSKSDYDFFKKLVKKKHARKSNKNLAGNLTHEYNLNEYIPQARIILDKVIINSPFANNQKKDHVNRLFHESNGPKIRFHLGELWVNYMQKNEFNPLHHHSGIFSFVLFIDTKMNFKKEDLQTHVKDANNKLPGRFAFYWPEYISTLGERQLDVDKKWEGRGLLFRSDTSHTVYPFSVSKGPRITISGNYFVTLE